MELFQQDGCLSDEGLHALIDGQLDELGRLETAEHLSYCDKCMDRYTALLTADVMEEPPRSPHKAVMATIWVRLMQNTYGRAAVASVAAVLALTMWRSGALTQIMNRDLPLKTWTPTSSQTLPDSPTEPERLGKPAEEKHNNSLYSKLTETLDSLLPGKNKPATNDSAGSAAATDTTK